MQESLQANGFIQRALWNGIRIGPEKTPMSSGTFLDSHPIPEALSERSKNGSSDLAQLLFWIRKHASLHIVRQTHWIASTGMNEANSPVNSRKVEVCLFYYPWGELDDLFLPAAFFEQ